MYVSVVRLGLGLRSKRQELIAMGHHFDYEVEEEGGGCFASLKNEICFHQVPLVRKAVNSSNGAIGEKIDTAKL